MSVGGQDPVEFCLPGGSVFGAGGSLLGTCVAVRPWRTSLEGAVFDVGASSDAVVPRGAR